MPVPVSQVDPDTGEYVRDNRGFCIPVGVNEPGEILGIVRSPDGALHPRYTDAKATSKRVKQSVWQLQNPYPTCYPPYLIAVEFSSYTTYIYNTSLLPQENTRYSLLQWGVGILGGEVYM